MPKEPRPVAARSRGADNQSNRRRATWLYYMHGLTQREVADHLGISRSTVVRFLEEARARGEVHVAVAPLPDDCAGLEAEIEQRFGLGRAIVVPAPPGGSAEAIATGVGAALGFYLSDRIGDGMVVGIGWGRTLSAMVPNLRPEVMPGVTVLSLLGGLISSRARNIGDVSWRMAERLGAQCLMMPAPLVVNSAETKRVLIEDCGLDRLFAMARTMDLAVISCGETVAGGSSITEEMIPAEDYRRAVAAGAVADVMAHFIDDDGRSVPLPISERVMSVPPEDISQAREIVLACGGANRARAIRATLRRFGCQVLVTDEGAARALLAL